MTPSRPLRVAFAGTPQFAVPPLQSLLTTLCEPVLRPIRRLIPTVAGLDLSPMWAIIAIYAILILIRAV